MKDEKKKGRPTKYDKEFHDLKAFSYFSRGYTNALVAKKFQISPRTLDYWIENNESFKESVLDGREVSNSQSELKLHKMAHGYFQEVIEPKIAGGEVVMVTYKKFIPPSFSALRFEMINKMPQLYRDKVEETEDKEQDTTTEIIVKKANNE